MAITKKGKKLSKQRVILLVAEPFVAVLFVIVAFALYRHMDMVKIHHTGCYSNPHGIIATSFLLAAAAFLGIVWPTELITGKRFFTTKPELSISGVAIFIGFLAAVAIGIVSYFVAIFCLSFCI